jgi:outer membrane protein assembly factor BamE (lipoprotein component of BamABCDE complex)
MASTVGKIVVTACAAALLAGCAGIKDHRGYVMDTELAQGIQVGIDNKESVTKTLGRPTFVGQFDGNDWYYLSANTKQVPFRSAKTIDQDLLHIRFDAAGNVAAIDRTDETQVASINPSKDETPTLGRKRSFFDELFGNIGVFNSGALGQPSPDN